MKIRIGTKLILAVVLMAVAVIGVTAGFAYNFYRQSLLDEMTLLGEQLSGSMKTAIRRDMIAQNCEGIHKLIEEMGKLEDVADIRLFSIGGMIKYASNPAECEKTYDMTSATCKNCHQSPDTPPASFDTKTRIFEKTENHRYLSILDPIRNEKTCSTSGCHPPPEKKAALGILEITIPLKRMDNRIVTGKKHTAIFALAAIIMISVVLSFIIQRLIVNPIKTVVHATDVIGSGDLSQYIPGHRQDELGELIRSFNRMQEKLKVSQRQLILSEKLASIGKLAAGVAHEINNPLTGVLTFAEDLKDETPPDDPKQEDFQVIIRETMRCRQIVRGLLDFARQDKPAIEQIDLNEILKRTVKLVERLAPFQNIKIVMDLDNYLPIVRGDAGQLQQVYLNLLVNAAEAMPSGGDILVQSFHEKGDPFVETSVTDTGKGMSAEQRLRIFEPFFSTKKGKTQGLGLAVSWGIIESHGGSIDAVSQPEKGSTFIVRLPAAREARRDGRKHRSAGDGRNANG